ncbi:hypothetical protein SEUCBS139899_007300 [Sporothrix eucalyptigena]|uniref:Peptidase A1 domain-containing protein n=1 Tax=Sporothrix eucalyptigena TaxID=1812306 RepID=A0ABP0C2X7_9PEZI
MLSTVKTQQELIVSLGLKKIVAKANKDFKPNGTKSYVKAMRKFGFTPTLAGPYQMVTREHKDNGKEENSNGHNSISKVLRKKLSDGTLGNVPAEDQQEDLEYLCEVSIGTPAQKLMLDFDSGSADLWVVSTELPASSREDHTAFDSGKSKTFKAMHGYSWKIEYGDESSASGDVGTDTVTIGGLTIPNQTVELAKKMSQEFLQSTGDGLLGLAWSSINTVSKCFVPKPQPTPLDNLIANQTLPEGNQFFTACFYSTRDAGKDSFYTFGYIDGAFKDRPIAWADVDNSSGFWEFPSTSITIGGQKTAFSGNTAIADTGTTLCLMSDNACKLLYSAIPGAKYDESAQGWVIPTHVTPDQIPEIKLAVGDNDFVLQAEDLVYGDADNGFWYGGVQSRGSLTMDIFGDVFLKSIYAIFDAGNVRFGAIPKIEANQNLGGDDSA